MKSVHVWSAALLSASVIVPGFFSGCAQAPESDQAVVQDEQQVADRSDAAQAPVDVVASKVEWVGTKVTGRHNGTLQLANGYLEMSEGKVVGGNFTIDMSTLKTSDQVGAENGLTDHLKSSDFFSVEEFPTATFVITSVQPTGLVGDDSEQVPEIEQYRVSNPTHDISGNLTIKGVSRNITFPASIQVGAGGTKAIAKFNIKRSDWGITYPGKPDDLIRDEVHIGIALRAGAPES